MQKNLMEYANPLNPPINWGAKYLAGKIKKAEQKCPALVIYIKDFRQDEQDNPVNPVQLLISANQSVQHP